MPGRRGRRPVAFAYPKVEKWPSRSAGRQSRGSRLTTYYLSAGFRDRLLRAGSAALPTATTHGLDLTRPRQLPSTPPPLRNPPRHTPPTPPPSAPSPPTSFPAPHSPRTSH